MRHQKAFGRDCVREEPKEKLGNGDASHVQRITFARDRTGKFINAGLSRQCFLAICGLGSVLVPWVVYCLTLFWGSDP